MSESGVVIQCPAFEPAHDQSKPGMLQQERRPRHFRIYIGMIITVAVLLLLVSRYSPLCSDDFAVGSIKRYEKERQLLFDHEEHMRLGNERPLNTQERQVNAQLMQVKYLDLSAALMGMERLQVAQEFTRVREDAHNSQLFDWLRGMPKGAVLNAQDMALLSVDGLIELMRHEHLWLCESVGTQRPANGTRFLEFRWARTEPAAFKDCRWWLLKELREQRGADELHRQLRVQLTMQPLERSQDEDGDDYKVWIRYGDIFYLVRSLLCYVPVWTEYFERVLAEHYEDGVRYLEFRSIVPQLYDLDYDNYTMSDTVSLMENAVRAFRQQHTDFIGAKLIYAPWRLIENDESMEEYLAKAIELKHEFPKFFAGFDLTGLESGALPLHAFAPQLFGARNELNFYFRAGETYWCNGDDNLLDAVLLGSKRIGHALMLPKHPELMRLVKQSNIAIEVCPIANQLLHGFTDLRAHPAAVLLSRNFPIVVGSDSPGYWDAKPLTDDFYAIFMGIAALDANLGMLKQLALNSWLYSALDAPTKQAAINMWEVQWANWIESVLP